ncbi:hypothetical protein WOLCODRAFT_150222 [Wolfiporia cocos MD-104 SS10]|uniref:YEATS domain-containing protein n=1 Tax=Wolfiporia cocos (strain MD-104) TaxID=742152 RepID=A0A2H3JK00_WOLCO|nr:hypothetical protein WOLCODRAFT_150222 [Wolfiporia cocos MD-104 SS10]
MTKRTDETERQASDRPAKRRRTLSEQLQYSHPTPRQLLLEEIDVELGLRERLCETVQSRLRWASLLQESLGKNTRNETSNFQDAALDALDAAEEPCHILFDREIRLPEQPLLSLSSLQANAPVVNATIPLQSQPPTRTGPSRRTLPRALPLPSRKLLFLRNTNVSPPEIAKLACPDCSRSDFSSLQGLLNHCRLRHQREFGSHDECVQSCAVIVPEEERQWVVANGTELGGISLPSLRRLFEIAVGAGDNVLLPGLQHASSAPKPTAEGKQTESSREATPASTHITQTLGHHADTPALAPFLGRAPKERAINVYGDPDEIVDITGDCQGTTLQAQGTRRWRMPYNHRSVARHELDDIPPLPETSPDQDEAGDYKPDTQPTVDKGPAAILPNLAGSRFHIVARVKVADQSLWIPSGNVGLHLDQDVPTDGGCPSHLRPMSVFSRVYPRSLHITTFLTKLTITCVTDPPPSTFVEPIVVTDPPFVATGIADKPFLTRLTFTWAGTTNPSTDIEHWVDLDPLHNAYPTLGDEQVFDVELDRNTELFPVRPDTRKITWKDETSGSERVDTIAGEEGRPTDLSAEPDAEPGYAVTLRALLSQIPITTKDMKGRFAASQSFLIPSRMQFNNLVPGRRKAIEMSRARALKDTYEQHVASLSEKGGHIPLSTADVYRWMERESMFPRPRVKRKTPTSQEQHQKNGIAQGSIGLPAFCRTCGLNQLVHPTDVKIENEDTDRKHISGTSILPQPSRSICLSFNGSSVRIPLFDVYHLLESLPGVGAVHGTSYGLAPTMFMPPATSHNKRAPPPGDLINIAHPRLVTAIRSISAAWKLQHLGTTSQGSSGVAELSETRQVVTDQLAPFALLATVTRCMIRLLVRRGVETYRQDETALQALGHQKRKMGRQQTSITPRRILTPSHILRGLAVGAQRELVDCAALLTIAELGVGNRGEIRYADMMRDENSAVKIEEQEPVSMSENQ